MNEKSSGPDLRRPRDVSPALLDILVDAVARGTTLRAACRRVGLSVDLIDYWSARARQDGPMSDFGQFQARLDNAQRRRIL